jgi:hypothetical protein
MSSLPSVHGPDRRFLRPTEQQRRRPRSRSPWQTTRGVASSSYAAASGFLGPLTIHDRRTCRMFTAQSPVGCSSTRRVSGTCERGPDIGHASVIFAAPDRLDPPISSSGWSEGRTGYTPPPRGVWKGGDMEAHPGVFTSDLDAQDWEPLAEVPGPSSTRWWSRMTTKQGCGASPEREHDLPLERPGKGYLPRSGRRGENRDRRRFPPST